MNRIPVKLDEITTRVLALGLEGEKDHVQFAFDASSILSEYPDATVALSVKPPVGDVYPVAVEKDGTNVLWTVSAADCAHDGDGQYQLTFTHGEEIEKTFKGFFKVYDSIVGNGTAPTPVQEWLAAAQEALNALEDVTASAHDLAHGESATAQIETVGNHKNINIGVPAGAPGQDGQDGEDGFSPVITVTDIAGGHRLSIETKTGTQTVDVMDGTDGKDGKDGTDGQDGYSPTVSVTDITGGHRITITDKTGAHTVDVMDGNPATLIDDTAPALDKTFSSSKIAQENQNLLSQIQAKQDAPETAGTAGQVLGLDDNLDPEWKTVSGGGTVDSSLSTSSTNPVQNKVITAEINNIESATVTINNVHEETDLSTSLEYEMGKYTTPAGYVGSSSSYNMTEKFAVNEGEVYSTTSKWNNWRYVTAYNGNDAIEAKGATNVKTYTVPSGVTHLVITFYSDHNLTSGAVIRTVDYVEWKNNLEDDLDAEEATRASADEAITADVNIIKNATVKVETISKEVDITADLTWVTGQYIDKTGYNGASASYNRCTKFAVNVGDVYKITWSNSNWRYVTAYNGDTAVEAKGAANVNTYTVPEGITHLVFTLYADNLMTYKSVIRVDSVPSYENNATIREPSFVKRKARVTFIDDDGYAEFYTYFVPIMQEYSVPMCSAYMGDVCPTFVNPTYMTEAQCKTVEQLGGEIVVHGGTSLTEFATVEQAEANVVASKKALEAHGFKSDVYVYPGGANNVEIREMMSKHFKCAFKTGAPQKGDTRVNDKCVPHYFIHRCSAGGYFDDKSADYGNYDTYTLDYFKALVDDAIANKGWLVFMTHAWMMPIGCSYRLQHDAGNGVPADLDEFGLIEDIIEYIQTKKNNGDDIEIVTASEGFEMFKNEVQSGDYLGWWNEKYTGTYQNSYWHEKAGFAVNKLGDIDFANGNRISHT